MKRLTDQHQEKIVLLDKQFLQQRHHVLQSNFSSAALILWGLFAFFCFMYWVIIYACVHLWMFLISKYPSIYCIVTLWFTWNLIKHHEAFSLETFLLSNCPPVGQFGHAICHGKQGIGECLRTWPRSVKAAVNSFPSAVLLSSSNVALFSSRLHSHTRWFITDCCSVLLYSFCPAEPHCVWVRHYWPEYLHCKVESAGMSLTWSGYYISISFCMFFTQYF